MTQKNGLEEYKDAAGENRIRVRSQGRITIASTEGYKNKKGMRQAAINGAITVLEHYQKDLTNEQHIRLNQIVLSNV